MGTVNLRLRAYNGYLNYGDNSGDGIGDPLPAERELLADSLKAIMPREALS